jgi:hypothetical protein
LVGSFSLLRNKNILSIPDLREAEDKPAAQVLRDFMRAYVQQRERRAFEADARRQSLEAVERADPNSDEARRDAGNRIRSGRVRG